MIFSEPKSELQVRLHIAELLKDKIEYDNYSELCEKMFIWVTNGIVLPLTAKDPLEETMLNLSKAIQNGGNIVDSLPQVPQLNYKEVTLQELATKNSKKMINYKDENFFICGYSLEFDCLIAGNDNKNVESDKLGHTDVLFDIFSRYIYVPKDVVK